MWELDNKKDWALKNWCLCTVVLGKTLESPLDCMEIKPVDPKNKSTLNIHWRDLVLKCQCFGHPMWRTDSLEKTLMLGKIEGRERGQWRMRWLDGITESMDMSLIKCQRWRTGKPGVPQGHKELGMTEELNNNNNKRYSPVAFKHGCSLGTYLELWRKKSNTCAFVFLKKFQDSRLPWWPSGQDSVIPMQGA